MASSKLRLSADELLQRLECPVCHELYHSPKMLPCGHTQCRSPCLEQIVSGKSKVRCPECRTEHDVPQTGVDGFPNNIALSRTLEEPASTENGIQGCPLCGDDEPLVKCSHCDLKICDDCRHKHTPKLQHQLLELVSSFKKDLELKATACSDLEQYRNAQIRSSADIANLDIAHASKRLKLAIDNRTKELKRQVSTFVTNENENDDLQHGQYREIIEQSAKFCEEMLCELSSDLRLAHVRLANIKENLEENKLQVDQRKRLINEDEKPSISVQLNINQVEANIENMGDVHVSGTAKTGKCKVKLDSLDLMNKSFTNELTFGGLRYPLGIAKHPTSNDIYVVDNNNHRIQAFNEDGTKKFSFGSGGCTDDQFKCPVGIICIKSEQLVITDQSNHRVKVHDLKGTFIRAFGEKGKTLGKFDRPLGLAQDQMENIHICDSFNKRVQVFDEYGNCKYEYNTWKSVAHQDVQFISISDSGMIAIQLEDNIVVLNKSLTLQKCFQAQHGLPGADLVIVNDSHIIAADNANCKLKVYTLDGGLKRVIDISDDDPDEVTKRQRPTGIAIDGEDIYVAFSWNNVVVKFF